MATERELVDDVRDAFRDAVEKAIAEKAPLAPFIRKINDELTEMIENLTYDVEDRLKDRIDQYASERADRIIAAFLRGDEEALREYLKLGRLHYTGREHAGVYTFENSTFEKRQTVFKHNSEWLTDERVKDLEALADGLRKRAEAAERRVDQLENPSRF